MRVIRYFNTYGYVSSSGDVIFFGSHHHLGLGWKEFLGFVSVPKLSMKMAI